MVCRLCGSEGLNTPLSVQEQMFGMGTSFEYFFCDNCTCLQIAEIPEDLHKYYGEGYYSFNNSPSSKNILYRTILASRIKYYFTGKGLLGKIGVMLRPNEVYSAMKQAGANTNSSMLDVGCGNGYILYWLKEYGFSNVEGIDPHIDSSFTYANGLTIKKKTLFDVDERWDIAILSHSLEHMDNHNDIFKQLWNVLEPDGIAIIATPNVSCNAFKTYKENWFQIDAPRHLIIHSEKSIEYLADLHGFSVEKVIYDSTDQQFIISQMYEKNISLTDYLARPMQEKYKLVSLKERRRLAQKAKELNSAKEGDQFIAILRKKNNHVA